MDAMEEGSCEASRASRFLPKPHRHLPSAIVGAMIRNRQKVKELVNLERHVCSDEVSKSAGRASVSDISTAPTPRHGRNVVPASPLGLTYTIQMRWDINRGRRQADARWDRKRFFRPSIYDEKGFRVRP